MTEQEKAKLAAAGKIAFGIFRMGGAIATASGHGLIGRALKQRHMMPTAIRLGKAGVQGGFKMFNDGIADWERASGSKPAAAPTASAKPPAER